MGHGITQVAAQAGYEVLLVDASPDALARGMAQIGKGLGRLVDKGKLTAEERDLALARIHPVSSIAMLAGAAGTGAANPANPANPANGTAAVPGLVVEAVVERYEVKQAVLAELDRVCPPETILATNTSSISITRLAAATKRPGKVIGMHFMNPVPLMQLIEVIRGLATTQETYDAVEAAARRMGKTPVEVHDAPGFVSNRVLMPMINEAIFCLYEGVGKPEAIDVVMKLGMNHPMGPLALADLIGLDVCLDILRVLQQGFGDPKYRPCPLLVKMVDAGQLGRKSGRGFYEY
jgi:3-hydroxybutyryl-CoA dehydrogenase